MPQSQIPRLLLIFNIDSLGIRRRTLANAFAGRLMSTLDDDNATARQKLQAKKTQIALHSSEAFQRIVPLVTKPLRKDQTKSFNRVCNVHTASPFQGLVAILLPSSTFSARNKMPKATVCSCHGHLWGSFTVLRKRSP